MLRERAGLTLDQAAPRLYKTRSSLHWIEVGETRADVHLIKSMMDLYDVRDDELIDPSSATASAPRPASCSSSAPSWPPYLAGVKAGEFDDLA